MRTDDAYLKGVLTVIAICLVWLCVLPFISPVAVEAQNPSQPARVYIAGWIDSMGQPVRFTHRMATGEPSPGIPVVTFSAQR